MSLNLTAIDAVLFDLDGTLLDSAPDLGFAANQLRTTRGMQPLPQSHYRPFVGTGARGMLHIALGITPDAENFENLKEEFFQNYEQCMGMHSELFEGVTSLIHAFESRALPWGIVTNKSERFTFPIVATITAFKSASVVICGDTTPHSKPHPEPLREAASRMQVQAERCIYVGDDERDVVAAHAAGMQSVAAAYGYLGNASAVTEWKPNAIIKSTVELTRLLGLD